jgi:ureidoacrylate peracid hydrolase
MILDTRTNRLDTIDFTRIAVVVVDVQNDFTHPDGALGRVGIDVAKLAEVIDHINQINRLIRESGGKIIFLQSTYTRADGSFIHPAIGRHASRRWSYWTSGDVPFLREGHWGVDLDDRVEFSEDDLVVQKHAYNGFFQNNLQSTLLSMSATCVVMTGVTGDCCVLATSQAALAEGHDVVVPLECIASYDAERHGAAVSMLDRLMGTVVSVEDIRSAVAHASNRAH